MPCLGLVLAAIALAGVTSPLDAQTPPHTAGLVVSGATVVGGPLVPAAVFLNPILTTLVQGTGARTLLELRQLDDPLAQNDPDLEVAIYSGLDLDGDPTNDFSGSAQFGIDPLSLAADGSPLVLFTPGMLTGGMLSAGPGTLVLGPGLSLPNLILSGQVATGAASFASDGIPTVVPTLLFEQIPAPAPFTGTLLDILLFFNLDPDLDLDGDLVPDAYSVEVSVTAVSCQILHGASLLRGDCNGDQQVDLGDVVSGLIGLFFGTTGIPCVAACDVSADGTWNLVDSIALLDYLFLAGPPPPAPFPTCAPDPAASTLGCLGPGC